VSPSTGAGRGNYAGCLGSSNDAGATPSKFNGVIGRRRNVVKLKQITDGTSNTIAAGEMRGWDWKNGAQFGTNNRYFPVWVGCVDLDDDWDNHLRIGGDGTYVISGAAGTGAPKPINSISATLQDDRGQSFGSNHPGGANFVFADGSVHFIEESINLSVYEALCSRFDGKAVTLPP